MELRNRHLLSSSVRAFRADRATMRLLAGPDLCFHLDHSDQALVPATKAN